VTGQTTDGAPHASGWRVPVELLVVLGPGTEPPPGSDVPPAPAASPSLPATVVPAPPLTALDALRQVVPVSQDFPPRLALVPLPASAAHSVTVLPFVVGVYATAPPAEVLATLGDREQIFVGAWAERVAAAEGDDPRRGPDLPWDAPGYEPPDAPRAS
jgi:hypothetical protein